jgi:hypothetical protein
MPVLSWSPDGKKAEIAADGSMVVLDAATNALNRIATVSGVKFAVWTAGGS